MWLDEWAAPLVRSDFSIYGNLPGGRLFHTRALTGAEAGRESHRLAACSSDQKRAAAHAHSK